MSVQDDGTPIDVLIEAPSIEENSADWLCAGCGHAARDHAGPPMLRKGMCWVSFCECLGFTLFTR